MPSEYVRQSAKEVVALGKDQLGSANKSFHPTSLQQFYARYRKALSQSRAYVAIVAKAEEIGWPERFRADLFTHDRDFCVRNADKPFCWVAQEGSTFLLNIEPNWHYKWDCLRRMSDVRWFWWDGKQLEEVGPNTALWRLEEYEERERQERMASARSTVCK